MRDFSVKNVIIFKPENNVVSNYLYCLLTNSISQEIFSAQTATELTDNIITPAEHERLADCGLAFSLALTLAFSAKESAFKASEIQTDAGFLDYQIISWNKQQVIIHRENEMFAVHWQIKEKIVITLCQHD